MASRTASLIIRLTDQVSGPAKQAAGALKGLAGAGDGLSRLKNAGNGLDQLAKRLEALQAKASKLGDFRAAGRGLQDLGRDLRKAGEDLAAAEQALARAKAAGDKAAIAAARAQQASAERAVKRTRTAYDKQRSLVQGLRAEVLPDGAPITKLLGTERRLKTLIAATTREYQQRAAAQAESAAKAAASARAGTDIEALLPKNLGKPAAQAAAGLAQVTTQAKATRAAVQQLAPAPPPFGGFSDDLKRDLAALDLTRGQVRALARDFTRMRAEQVAALGPINPRYHAQILEQDRGKIEDKLRERARRMAEETKVAAALSPGSGSSRTEAASILAASREKIAAERLAAAESVRVARAAAREKLQIAREAARAARQAEREAGRESSQAAREVAQAARQAAREKIAAAREAAAAVKAAAREEAAALRAVSRERTRLDRESRRFRGEAGGHARAAAGAIGLGGGAYGATRLAGVGARNAGERATETARGRAVGLTPAEDKLGEARAFELSRRFPSLDPTGLRELYRALHVNLGGNAAAASDTLVPVARAQVLLQNFRKREEAQADLARIIRGAENAGFGDKPEKFTDYLQGAIKGMQLFGDTLRGEDYYQYAKTGRLAVAGLSPRFLGAIAPSIIDDMGGPSAGQAHYTAYNAVVAGRMKKESKKVAAQYGLMGKDGRMIGRDIFQRDPLEWALNVLEPAFAKKGKGFKDGDINPFVDTLATIFNDRNAAEFIGKLVTKQGELKRNEERFGLVRGLPEAEKVRTENPGVAADAAKTQGATLLGQLLEPAVAPATAALNSLADAASRATEALRKDPDTLNAAAAPAGLLAAIVGPQVAGWLMKKVAGDAPGVLANLLRMGGGALSTTGSSLGYGAAIGAPAAAGLAGNEAETVNEQGAFRAARGEEATTGRLTREIREARRQQQSLKGQIDGLQERITREQGVVDQLTAKHGDAAGSPVAATVKDARARIERLTAERDALSSQLRGQSGWQTPPGRRGTVQTPAPPPRPAEFGGTGAIAPKVDTAPVQELNRETGEAKDKLTEINGLTISPKADVSGLRQITSEANTAAAALQRVIALAGQANASIARVNAAAPGGGSTGRVRQALSDNFA
ncbi:hypothetical protein [Methylobacterium isbiliense]|uniref:Chromosome partition protein Smc n=1 Tax=Methylobacterium isbiliense TaxID=315478 RepID=A0ABQ4SDZ7_9HYPH|nr:hypothetical protein [Methylobacterium isbiliense]MDN3625585.1 hypothetical protein [Methylobacterium isbiliense]GJE00020.1 hypothetical protein GMJLKIPL_1938 [Methylobacterium isbiliense]